MTIHLSPDLPDDFNSQGMGLPPRLGLAQIGMVGLAAMGSNLAKNIESRGFPCAVYNLEPEKTTDFKNDTQGRQFIATESLPELVATLTRPGTVFMMVKAGPAVDSVLEQVLPYLGPGDIVIDGGNSHFRDTERRQALCKPSGVHFMGVGVSGGAQGALTGPCIMPGGSAEAWAQLAPLLSRIAGETPDNMPCTAYIGPGGAGHFVKMAHNGIEYADMQALAESYDVLRRLGGFSHEQLADSYARWNTGRLGSFLVELTATIMNKADPKGKGYWIDNILDKGEQKGTGKWTVQEALNLGVPVPTIAAAVDARALSALKAERVAASGKLGGPQPQALGLEPQQLLDLLEPALYATKVISYAQGMHLLATASAQYEWQLKLGEIADIWRGGCIIRAALLKDICNCYSQDTRPVHLMLAEPFRTQLERDTDCLREIVPLAQHNGVPVPCMAASLAYYDAYRCSRLPQNLTQAQRNSFGEHGIEPNCSPT